MHFCTILTWREICCRYQQTATKIYMDKTDARMVNVLIVDDDEDLLEMVTLMLRASSMLVKTLNTGALLLETVGAQPPDVLLMDIFLGDSDGRQLCKQLKSSRAYSGFPVFLYSAGEITNASIVESDADYFLRKPFEMSHLVARIHESLKK
jgi:DNA-binding response OmpR family regulator